MLLVGKDIRYVDARAPARAASRTRTDDDPLCNVPPLSPRAERGLRVQFIPELGRDKGSGTVQDVQGDLATVIWDSGEVDEGVPVGRAGQYYLRPKVHSLAPEANGNASPRQYVDQRSVDGLSLRQVQAGDGRAPPLYRPLAPSAQSPRQLPVRPVSPRVVRTRRAGEDNGEELRRGNDDGHGFDSAREGARSPLAPVRGRPRAVDRADLSMGLWEKMIAVDVPGPSSVQSGQRSSSPAPRQALVAKGGSTIGLSVYGTQIDYVVPGGPAHLSQKLDKDDEILVVDGVAVDFGNVVGCLQGTDVAGSKVSLRVRKHKTGEVADVQLTRVPKASMENLVFIFQTITQLKQNGHNNEGYERSSYPPEAALSMDLVDRLVTLISAVEIDRHNATVTLKKQFSQIYDDLRSHLQLAYDEIDVLRAQEHANSDYKEQCQRLTRQLEEVQAQMKEKTARAQRSAPPPPPAADAEDAENMKTRLAQELETGMQKEFEIRRLNAQSELLLKELETAKRTMVAKDRELQQRSLEDKELEKKFQALQGLLESTSGEAAMYKEECEKLRLHLEDVTINQVEKIQTEVSLLEAEFKSRSKSLEETLQARVDDSEKRIEALQKMLDERDRKLSETTKLEDIVKELQAKLAAVPENSYRHGDICEAAIISAHNLPGAAKLETIVMLALDHRHQVQQTRPTVGVDPIFEEDFVARLAADTKALTCAIYRSDPEQPGELVGSASIPIARIALAPGSQVEVPVMANEDSTKPLVVDGKQAMIKLFLARSNPMRSERYPEPGPGIDSAHVQKLEEDIASARLFSEKLEAELQAAKDQSKALAGVEQKLLQTKMKLDDSEKIREKLSAELGNLRDGNERQPREALEQLVRELQELVQQKQLEIQHRDSRLMILQEKGNFLTSELEKLRNSFQVKEQLLTDVEKELNASKGVIESIKRKSKAGEDAAAKNAQLEELACKLDEGMKQLMHVDEERRVAIAEVEEERAKSRALYERLRALENEHQMLKSELQRLMDDIEETKKLKSENAELTSLNARLRQEVDLARAAISEARQVETESFRLRREVADGRSRVTELEAEVARLQNQHQPADDDLPAVAKKERRAVQRSGAHLLASSHVCVSASVCLLTRTVSCPLAAAPPPAPAVPPNPSNSANPQAPMGRIGMKISEAPPHKVSGCPYNRRSK